MYPTAKFSIVNGMSRPRSGNMIRRHDPTYYLATRRLKSYGVPTVPVGYRQGEIDVAPQAVGVGDQPAVHRHRPGEGQEQLAAGEGERRRSGALRQHHGLGREQPSQEPQRAGP